MNVSSVEKLKAKFLSYYPGFKTFSEPGQKYIDDEDAYKREADQRMRNLFGDWA